jgi:hypothetical protein
MDKFETILKVQQKVSLVKLKTFLIINALVSGLSGLSALLIPAEILIMYGVDPNSAVTLMAQYSGLGSVAIGLITWFSRNIGFAQAHKSIIPALLNTHVIGIIISLMGTISGTMKTGWPVVGIYFIFSLGYFYFQFLKTKPI